MIISSSKQVTCAVESTEDQEVGRIEHEQEQEKETTTTSPSPTTTTTLPQTSSNADPLPAAAVESSHTTTITS